MANNSKLICDVCGTYLGMIMLRHVGKIEVSRRLCERHNKEENYKEDANVQVVTG